MNHVLPLPWDQALDAGRVPVYGIPEWYCWYHDRTDFQIPVEGVIEECLDAHRAVGIRNIVWNCGRGRVDYWSDVAGVTRLDEGCDASENSSAGFKTRAMARECPLRRALEYGGRQGMTLLGRLAMNRHYGTGEMPYTALERAHPDCLEKDKRGRLVRHKLCYAFEEVRRERRGILLEIQRIGVAALVLDFCRQVPILQYHEKLVEPFRQRTGVDPRQIDSADTARHAEWFQHRADILTDFMRELRVEVRRQESALGRPCPVIARIPDSAPWLLLAFGIDLERWFAEDLIDATMLSPFPLAAEDPERHFEMHVEWAHRHGKPCIGGLGSLNLIAGDGAVPNRDPEAFYDPRPAYEIVDRQFCAGVDAISVYQSENLTRQPYLRQLLEDLPQRDAVAQRLRELPHSRFPADYPLGLDWHAKWDGRYGVRRKAIHSIRDM